LEYNLILIKLEGDFLKLIVIFAFLQSSRGFQKLPKWWLANAISAKFKGFS
jgi:hypothetical protein